MTQSHSDRSATDAAISWPAIKLKIPLMLGYLASTTSLCISSVAQLVTFAVLARHLGVEQFGLLVTITAVTNLAMQLCGLGATETLVRRVSADPAIYRDALGHHLILIAATASIIVPLLAVALNHFISVSPDGPTNFVALLCFTISNVVLVRWIFVTEQVFIARFEYGPANLANIGFAVSRMLTALIACYGFGVTRLSDWALWHGGGHLVVAVVCAIVLSRFGRPRWTILINETKLGFYFCTPYFFLAIRQNIDLLVLNVVATPEVIGSYSVARRILDTSTLTVSGLHRLTYPKLAAISARGFGQTVRLARKLLFVVFAITGLTSVGVFVAAPVLPILFGNGFSRTIAYTRALCWIGILLGVQEMAAEALGASGRHAVRAAIYNGGSIVGAIVVATMTYEFLLDGTVTALYATESLVALTFWAVMIVMGNRETVAPSP